MSGPTLPVPYEGVVGPTGHPLLLSVNDRFLPVREALIRMGWHLLCATQVAPQAPVVARIYQRITNPQPGDLVVERTGLLRHLTESSPDRRAEFHRTAFGIFITAREEWVPDPTRPAPPPGGADAGGLVPGLVHYLQYAPQQGAVSRMVNSMLLTIPVGGDFSRPAGRPDPAGGFTVSRLNLLDALADIGMRVPSNEDGG